MAQVLIVDDDADSRQLLKLQIESAGHEVIERFDGPAGLDAVTSDHPDLVLLDVMMPEMDGWTVCRKIRENPSTAKVPVIILTARAFIGATAMAVESGADVYMEKPWDRKKLSDHITRLTAKK